MEVSGSGFWSAIGAFRRRFAFILLASFLVWSLLLLLAPRTDFSDDVAFDGGFNGSFSSDGNHTTAITTAATIAGVSVSGQHRKLLRHAMKELNRVPGDRCSSSDIVINQGTTTLLTNGIPAYTVEIHNQCIAGCSISRIHLSCGLFSSATVINPFVFKRLAYNDCLVNDGKPLACGASVHFEYSSTFPYPLSVTSLLC